MLFLLFLNGLSGNYLCGLRLRFRCGIGRFRHFCLKETTIVGEGGGLRFGPAVLVHLAFSVDQPLQIDERVVAGHVGDEIEARLVAAGQDVGDTGTGHADLIGELGLRDVLGGEKLLQSEVHIVNRSISTNVTHLK